MIVQYLIVAVVAYLLGSIPFGLLITRAAGLGDVRKIGSGNIGATNVLRTGRRELAAATLVLDALKGAAAVLLAKYVLPAYLVEPGSVATFATIGGYLAAIAVFLGHCYPLWLGFKGGKGVATLIGTLFGLYWPLGIVFCVVWLFIAATQRYSSLAALTAAVTAPIFAYAAFLQGWTTDGINLAAVIALLALWLIYNHRTNIARLLKNTEPKIGSEKTPANQR